MKETLGARIARLRKDKNLKQENLATLLNISPQAVSKWENDVTCPDISVLPELGKILGVSVDVLLSGEENKKKVEVVPVEERKDIKDLLLKIVVNSSDGDKVKINLPLQIIEACFEMGLDMPEVNGTNALKNIDIGKILELVRKGAIGNLVEVESSDGDIVQIFVE